MVVLRDGVSKADAYVVPLGGFSQLVKVRTKIFVRVQEKIGFDRFRLFRVKI